MNKIDFKIVLENFSFKMPNRCFKHHDKYPLIDISLSLDGNFLKAALTDDIDHTVDYDKLCKKIRAVFFTPFICEDKKYLTAIKDIVTSYPLITDGYIDLHIKCEGSFYKRFFLLDSTL